MRYIRTHFYHDASTHIGFVIAELQKLRFSVGRVGVYDRVLLSFPRRSLSGFHNHDARHFSRRQTMNNNNKPNDGFCDTCGPPPKKKRMPARHPV